jgi:DNA-binding CsgD family transcriptional regulator
MGVVLQMAESFRHHNGANVPHLTPRQLQIVGYVAAGLTDHEIAATLAISPRTVRMHCDAVRSRLAVARRRLIPATYRQLTGKDPLELLDADGLGD